MDTKPLPDGSERTGAAAGPQTPGAPQRTPAAGGADAAPGSEGTADPSAGLRRHLFSVTAAISAALVGYMIWVDLSPDSSLVVLTFLTGAFGGVLSAFRRFRLIGGEDSRAPGAPAHALRLHAYLSPMLGGMFGVILYLVMLTGILQGDFFPRFRDLDKPYEGLFALFHTTVPAENKDAIKAVFWAFIAGFSEAFVPNLLGQVSRRR